MNSIVINKLMLIPIVLFGIALFYWGLMKGALLLMPFILGYGISRLVSPVSDFIVVRFRLHRGLVVGLTMLCFTALGGIGIYSLGLYLFSAIGDLAVRVPTWTQSLIHVGDQIWSRMESWIAFLPEDLDFSLTNTLSTFASALSGRLGTVATRGLGIATSLPGLLVGVVVTLVSTFFFAKDEVLIQASIGPIYKRYIGSNQYIQSFRKEILSVLWGYLKAQLTLMGFTFTIVTVGLWIFGFKSAPLIGLGIGLVDALPLLGPASVFMPWILVSWFGGNTSLAIQLGGLYLVTTLTRQLLEPKILSAHIGVHPILTLMGLYLGIRFLGFPGLILGPLTMVALVATYKHYVQHEKLQEPAIMGRNNKR